MHLQIFHRKFVGSLYLIGIFQKICFYREQIFRFKQVLLKPSDASDLWEDFQ